MKQTHYISNKILHKHGRTHIWNNTKCLRDNKKKPLKDQSFLFKLEFNL